VVCGIMDSDMFTKLAAAASALTADRWNPTALSLFVNALVRADMKDDNLSRDMALLHQLADMQCEMYAAQGSRAFSSPAIMAQLLSSLVAANVQHVRLFTCASVVVTEHFRLGSPEPQVGNLLLPTGEEGGRTKGRNDQRNRKPSKKQQQIRSSQRFVEQATGTDLALMAGALHDRGVLDAELAIEFVGKLKTTGLPSGNTIALAAAIRAFGPYASTAAERHSREAHEILTMTFSLLSPAALTSAKSVKRLLTAMHEASWKDGASVNKLVMAICAIKTMSQDDRLLLEQSLSDMDMPRHTGPALAHLGEVEISA